MAVWIIFACLNSIPNFLVKDKPIINKKLSLADYVELTPDPQNISTKARDP